MCGIFAYLNIRTLKKRSEIIDILIQGLQRMEYRVYDYAELAIDGGSNKDSLHSETFLLRRERKVSVLADSVKKIEGLDMDMTYEIHCGIAHTRWTTHGYPQDVNSHPQRSNDTSDFVVVHNGIITNYREIKEYLMKKGHRFESETDTEVIAKLTQHVYDRYPDFSFRQLVEIVIQQLEGAFALAFKSRKFPGQLVASRRGSPLLVGIKSNSRLTTNQFPVSLSKARRFASTTATHLRDKSFVETPNILDLSTAVNGNGDQHPIITKVSGVDSSNQEAEYFFASDAVAIVEHTKDVFILAEDYIVFVDDRILKARRIRQGQGENTDQKRDVQNLTMELQERMKRNFKIIMRKAVFYHLDKLFLTASRSTFKDIKRCRRLIIVACGTSYNSAITCREILEELSEVPVVLELASDFLDREIPICHDDGCIFISQSGETVDTLKALRYCKDREAFLIGITNIVGSSICRESDCRVHINAGPEIGVASTKAYTFQILSLLMFALCLSDGRLSAHQRRSEIISALNNLPDQIRDVLSLDSQIFEIAKDLYQKKSLLIMGRNFKFSTCLDCALKKEELFYMYCEGNMSGKLQQGPLAMVDGNRRSCMVVSADSVYKETLNA